MPNPLFALAAAAAAAPLGINPDVVFGPRRTGPAIEARHLAMSLVLDVTGLDMEAVARGFGHSEHAVLYAKRKVADRRLTDADFAALYADLRASLVLASVGIKAVEMLRQTLLQRLAGHPEALMDICATLNLTPTEVEAAPWPEN